MCTLILATRVFDASPTFLASNRDERLDRPASDPILWETTPPFVGPRDELKGGTWLGVNAHGVIVAITNRFGASPDHDRRSRGALVVDALGGKTANAASQIAAGYSADAHNSFHLLLADENSAYVVWSDGSSITRFPLDAGVHIVTERSFGAAENARADFVQGVANELARSAALTPAALKRLLAIHRPNDFDALSVLLPDLNYGTRSSLVVDVTQRQMEFADGPPNVVPYLDYSDLLRHMLP